MNRKKISITILASAAAVVGFGLPADAAGNYPPGDYPPAVTVAPTPTGDLPSTGSDGSGNMVLIAASLLGAGGVLTLASRSRRTV